VVGGGGGWFGASLAEGEQLPCASFSGTLACFASHMATRPCQLSAPASVKLRLPGPATYALRPSLARRSVLLASTVQHVSARSSGTMPARPNLRFHPFRPFGIASHRVASPHLASITASLVCHHRQRFPNSFGKATSIYRCAHSSHSPALAKSSSIAHS
jgi:hypothetical protein